MKRRCWIPAENRYIHEDNDRRLYEHQQKIKHIIEMLARKARYKEDGIIEFKSWIDSSENNWVIEVEVSDPKWQFPRVEGMRVS